MLFDRPIRRCVGGTFLGVGVVGTSITTIFSVAHPAAAAAVLAAVRRAVTCATTGTTPCVSGTNTSSGIGVLGASNTGTGIRGTASTNFGIKGTSKTSYGVLGQSTSGPAGVAGSAGTRSGGQIGAGVFGVGSGDSSGTGIYGSTSGNGIAIFGSATSGTGVVAESRSFTGLSADSDAAVAVDVFSQSGAALSASSVGNDAVLTTASQVALEGIAPANGIPLRLTDTNGDLLFVVDGAGNVRYGGGLRSATQIAAEASVTAFSPKTAVPTVEDSGTAQLVTGSAAVRLDPTFAAAIDPKTSYRVFVTPNGDTRQLFVAATTPQGFIVRESQGGRSTVSFDYRVLATALGQAGQRMAIMSGAAPRVSLPLVPKMKPLPPISAKLP